MAVIEVEEEAMLVLWRWVQWQLVWYAMADSVLNDFCIDGTMGVSKYNYMDS